MPNPIAFTDIAENLSYLDDWEDRYKYIIELGQALPPLAEAEKNAATKVNGCVSQVWLVSEREGELLSYRGESDAMIVRQPSRAASAVMSRHWAGSSSISMSRRCSKSAMICRRRPRKSPAQP